ncbi:MAG TPA: hypothetical protein VNB06_21065 [Thermoanaerobaculia bacterium]|nr:hypothetical protein [Thermoanaerobaculia bacterium]
MRAGLVEKLVDAEACCRLLMTEVVKRGIDSRPGAAAYGRLLSTWDRWHRFAQAVGLERRQKPVSVEDYVRQKAAEARAARGES